ncbi:MAG: hypothetical protein ACKODK_05920, partial [Opitutaceae bacterium]
HWPTDEENTYVCFIRDGNHGTGDQRQGDPKWLRLSASSNGKMPPLSIAACGTRGKRSGATPSQPTPWCRRNCRDLFRLTTPDSRRSPKGALENSG